MFLEEMSEFTPTQCANTTFKKTVFFKLWPLLCECCSCPSFGSNSDSITESSLHKEMDSATNKNVENKTLAQQEFRRAHLVKVENMIQTCAFDLAEIMLTLMGISSSFSTSDSTKTCYEKWLKVYTAAADSLLASRLVSPFLGKHEFQQSLQQYCLKIEAQDRSYKDSKCNETCVVSSHVSELEQFFVLVCSFIMVGMALNPSGERRLLPVQSLPISVGCSNTNVCKSSSVVSMGTSSSASSVSLSVPMGVIYVVRAITTAVFLLSGIAPKPGANTRGKDEAEQKKLGKPVKLIWYGFLAIFLQQLSSRNNTALDLPAWEEFFRCCKMEAISKLVGPISDADEENEDNNEATLDCGISCKSSLKETCSGSTFLNLRDMHILSRNSFFFRVKLESLRTWETLTQTFLNETIARTRFRRAAILFKSSTPHIVSQAPGATFLMLAILHRFMDDWNIQFRRTYSHRGMSDAARSFFLNPWERASISSMSEGSEVNGKKMFAEEVDLVNMVQWHAVRLGAVLGETGVHGHLLATVFGTVLCTTFLLPYSRAPPPRNSRSSVGETVLEMDNAPEIWTLTAGSSRAMPSAYATRRQSDKKLSDPLDRFKAFMNNSADWLKLRAVEESSELEWRLGEFPPLGFLLRHLNINTLAETHLLHFITQLRIGLSPIQQAQSREKFALSALLSGLCDLNTTFFMYHFARDAAALPNGWATVDLRLPYKPLENFTEAVNDYVKSSKNEIALNLTPVEVQDAVAGTHSIRNRQLSEKVSVESEAVRYLIESIPQNGERQGQRFCRMKYPQNVPTWESFLVQTQTTDIFGSPPTKSLALASAPATRFTSLSNVSPPTPSSSMFATPTLISPCRFVLELLALRLYTWAASFINAMLRPPGEEDVTEKTSDRDQRRSVNIFLIPKHALEHKVNVQVYLRETLMHQLNKWNEASVMECSLPGTNDISPAWEVSNQTTPLHAQSLQNHFCWLKELFPLLELANAYLASQALMVPLMARLVTLCEDAVAAMRNGITYVTTRDQGTGKYEMDKTSGLLRMSSMSFVRSCFALTELYLTCFIMPCLRVLPPTPLVYSYVQRFFHILQKDSLRVGFGPQHSSTGFLHFSSQWLNCLPTKLSLAQFANSTLALPTPESIESNTDQKSDTGSDVTFQPFTFRSYFHPHDRMRMKKLEDLFQQSLKRINSRNVDYYRILLREVLYSHPLYVIDCLLKQAVGYENSFLSIHTRVLLGLPTPIIIMAYHYGLYLMQQFSAEERINETSIEKTSRVALIAHFLATLWRDNAVYEAKTQSENPEKLLTGSVLVNAAESALREYTRHSLICGLEMLKAVLYQLTNRRLEHEEQLSEIQIKSLAVPGPVARLFGKGVMDSFRSTRWNSWQTPASLVVGRSILLEALEQPLSASVEVHSDRTTFRQGDEGSKLSPSKISMSLGSWILFHLCRLQNNIYELQSDLEGSVEDVLLTSAKDYNTLNDLIFAFQELMLLSDITHPLGPPAKLLGESAMPHVCQRLTAKFAQRRNTEGKQNPLRSHFDNMRGRGDSLMSRDPLLSSMLPLTTLPILSQDEGELREDQKSILDKSVEKEWLAESIGFVSSTLTGDLLQRLSFFSTVHFIFDEEPYHVALESWKICMAQIGSNARVFSSLSERADEEEMPNLLFYPLAFSQSELTLSWMKSLGQRIEAEREAHKLFHEGQSCLRLREELFDELKKRVLLPDHAPGKNNEGREARLLFVSMYLLPRALLNLEETFFVKNFIEWLFLKSHTDVRNNDTSRRGRDRAAVHHLPSCYESVLDLVFLLTTKACCLFIGLTDSESKRLGYLINHIQQMLRPFATVPLTGALKEILQRQITIPATSGRIVLQGSETCVPNERNMIDNTSVMKTNYSVTASNVRLWDDYLSPVRSSLWNAICTSSSGNYGGERSRIISAKGTLTSAPAKTKSKAKEEKKFQELELKAYPLQLEAYLCRMLVQFLSNSNAVPGHIQRNVFLFLERFDKKVFPSTMCATELLIRTVAPHAEPSKKNFASAIALLKALHENLKAKHAVWNSLYALVLYYQQEQQQRKKNTRCSATLAELEDARKCFRHWRVREGYMFELLKSELSDAGHPIIDIAADTVIRSSDESVYPEQHHEEASQVVIGQTKHSLKEQIRFSYESELYTSSVSCLTVPCDAPLHSKNTLDAISRTTDSTIRSEAHDYGATYEAKKLASTLNQKCEEENFDNAFGGDKSADSAHSNKESNDYDLLFSASRKRSREHMDSEAET